MTIFLILGLIFIFMGCLGHYLSSKRNNTPIIIYIWSFLFTIVGLAIIFGIAVPIKNSKQPEAIDVYRGKTELVIIHYDSNNIDSVVVWKD